MVDVALKRRLHVDRPIRVDLGRSDEPVGNGVRGAAFRGLLPSAPGEVGDLFRARLVADAGADRALEREGEVRLVSGRAVLATVQRRVAGRGDCVYLASFRNPCARCGRGVRRSWVRTKFAARLSSRASKAGNGPFSAARVARGRVGRVAELARDALARARARARRRT
jgi:hypothetical protein